MLLWVEAATAADLAAIFRERDEAFRADLREEITAGITSGTIRPEVAAGDVRSCRFGVAPRNRTAAPSGLPSRRHRATAPIGHRSLAPGTGPPAA